MKPSPKFRRYAICLASFVAVFTGLSVFAGQGAAHADTLGVLALKAYDEGDSARAASLWRRAALAGGRDAMTAYAGLLEQGDGISADSGLAWEWYARAAEHGEPHAMVLLAEARMATNPADTEAFTLMTRAAALGHVFAIRRLAELSGNDDTLSADSIGDHK